MFGWSTGALRLARMHGIDPTSLSIVKKPSCSLVSVEDVSKELDKLPRRRHTACVCPLFCSHANMVRDYQWEVLRSSFRKSGFVVAPCGAGKTLMGLLAASANGGRFLVLTTRYADQWKQTLSAYFDPIGTVRVAVLGKDPLVVTSPPGVVIATYSGLGARSSSTDARVVRMLPYQTIILDEAHTAASPSNLAIVDSLFANYVLALTATKVREDSELEKLEARIGTTLISIERTRLVDEGFVSDVRCINLLVPYGAELERLIGRTASLALDSNKVQVLCSTLLRLHADGHKTLVFCDDLFCLDWASRLVEAFGIPTVGSVSMRTPSDERTSLIDRFSDTVGGAILFVSRTGDEALDIPNASAGVVFWNHWGSRRQVVQRLGRIARISEGGPPPIFIVLLSDDSRELERSKHREVYMKEHGFSCQTLAQEASVFGTRCRTNNEAYVKRVAKEWCQAGRGVEKKAGAPPTLPDRPARKRPLVD